MANAPEKSATAASITLSRLASTFCRKRDTANKAQRCYSDCSDTNMGTNVEAERSCLNDLSTAIGDCRDVPEEPRPPL
jgi:hypothetical protein